MLPHFLVTGAMVTIWLLFIRLLEAYLPEGSINNAVHFLYK